MAAWVKTPRGWVLRDIDTEIIDDETPAPERISSRSKAVSHNSEVSVGRNLKVQGTKGQRRLIVCVSEFLEYMDLMEAVRDIPKKAYLYNLMTLVMTKGLGKVSGCAQRQLFKILEAMVTEAISSEFNVVPMKKLLVSTMQSMLDANAYRIGSKSLWNRHIHTVANLSTKMEQFHFSERVEDGLLRLTDLPKECILEIMLKLPDHKDIVNLGKTCTELYYITQDSSLWQKLVQFHFTEKQMSTFIEDTEYIDSSVSMWQSLQHKCSRKFGLKRPYADQLVICSACRTLHWLMQGHTCWPAKEGDIDVYLEPVSTEEMYSILFSVQP